MLGSPTDLQLLDVFMTALATKVVSFTKSARSTSSRDKSVPGFRLELHLELHIRTDDKYINHEG